MAYTWVSTLSSSLIYPHNSFDKDKYDGCRAAQDKYAMTMSAITGSQLSRNNILIFALNFQIVSVDKQRSKLFSKGCGRRGVLLVNVLK